MGTHDQRSRAQRAKVERGRLGCECGVLACEGVLQLDRDNGSHARVGRGSVLLCRLVEDAVASKGGWWETFWREEEKVKGKIGRGNCEAAHLSGPLSTPFMLMYTLMYTLQHRSTAPTLSR